MISLVRENIIYSQILTINFRYDPVRAANKLWSQPVLWIGRNIQIFFPFGLFVLNIVGDIINNKEQINRKQRACELLNLISAQVNKQI